MIDETFIENTLQKGREAKEKARSAFSNISEQQLNWKPSPATWSIAQCLDHLYISHSAYFPDLEKIVSTQYQMSFWEKYSPLTRVWGKMFKASLKEDVGRKMKAPKKLQPNVTKDISFIEDYLDSVDKFLEYISKCDAVDVDKIIITSPIIRMVTYNLRDTLQFLIQHEHRHINQAMRVKSHEQFPS